MSDVGELDPYELLAATSATLGDALQELLEARECARGLSRALMALWVRAHGPVSPKDVRRIQDRCGDVLGVLDSAVSLAEDRLAQVDAARAKLPIH